MLNTSQRTIDLTGVHFSDGITFDFPENTTLARRTRLILVRDLAAFTERYGEHAASAIAGLLPLSETSSITCRSPIRGPAN